MRPAHLRAAGLVLGALSLAVLVLQLAACRSAGAAEDEPAPRPNILLFLVDDLGWQDLSVPLGPEVTDFNRRYRTPAMARLAREGRVFTDAYAASPVCTPTRVSILTGRHPARLHVTNWTLHAGKDQTRAHPDLAWPAWNVDGLQGTDVTLPGLLRDAGYRTIHVGKAHFGARGTSGEDPTNLGFDVNVAGHAAGGPGSHYGQDHYSATRRSNNPRASRVWDVPGLEAYHGTDTYLTEALTLEALAALEEAAASGEPFFMNMAHYAVHAPIMADEEYVGNYPGLDAREAAYASMVEGVDASLGALLDKLDELGLADDTLVVCFSDNGGLSAHGRGGEKHVHNAPLRSGKGSAYEGGIRVPLIVRWPGRVDAGGRSSAPVIAYDLFPTFLSAARVPAPGGYTTDGVDLTEHWAGAPLPERLLAWHYPHRWGADGPGVWPFTAVRDGDWKLLYDHAGGRFELYDLARDLGEREDLAELEPQRTARLAAEMSAWLRAVGAQMPTFKESGRPVPFPDEPPAGEGR